MQEGLRTFENLQVGGFRLLYGLFVLTPGLEFLGQRLCLEGTVDGCQFLCEDCQFLLNGGFLRFFLLNQLRELVPLFLQFFQTGHQLVIVVLKRSSLRCHTLSLNFLHTGNGLRDFTVASN